MDSPSASSSNPADISTRFLILSDTHGMEFDGANWTLPSEKVDVAIHCGDLTQESKLDEFRTSIELLQSINATLKIVIAGNHEITLDQPVFERHLARANLQQNSKEVEETYGRPGQAKQMLESAAAANIRFLDEGTHHIILENGAFLTLYVSPYTPRKADEAFSSTDAGWAFQYGGHNVASPAPAHAFDIRPGTDVVVTHGPPRGIMDYADSKRNGCPDLFAAVARAKPKLHCFGHVHNSWGAKLVAWRDQLSEQPSHFTDIDNGRSEVLESLRCLKGAKFDSPEEVEGKKQRYEELKQQGFCALKPSRGGTLFVNAAMEGSDDCPVQPPFVVDVDLSVHQGNRTSR